MSKICPRRATAKDQHIVLYRPHLVSAMKAPTRGITYILRRAGDKQLIYGQLDNMGVPEGVETGEVVQRLNGEVERENVVSNMTFPPWRLVAFHSEVMTLLPGDVISTGTPGAVVIRSGDVLECRITGFEPLSNPVFG